MPRCLVLSRCCTKSRSSHSLSTELHDSKSQPRKLVWCNIGFSKAPTRYRHILLLLLSIHCIAFTHCVSPPSVTGLGKPVSSSTSSTGKDSNSRGSNGVSPSDDGESSSHLYHHHNYRHHHHRHSTSGKNSVSSPSIYPSTSALGYQEYSPLSYYNSDPYYEPRHYERPSREFSARSTSYPAMAAAASSSQVGFSGDTEYGGLALATGHGGGHGGHGGHGHDSGYGHQHHTYHKTVHKLDQSSLGLLGLLGLLSLLSNVLLLLTTTASTTTAAPAPVPYRAAKSTDGNAGNPRLKRDTMMLFDVKNDDKPQTRPTVYEQLSHLILPSLNIVGHAKDGRIPLNCTYQEVCKTNKVLIQVFGSADGRPVAAILSTAIIKLLANEGNNHNKGNPKNHYKIEGGHQATTTAPLFFRNLLTEAGLAGRNGENCEIAFPTCKALSDIEEKDYSTNGITKERGHQLPFLVSPERAVAIITGQSQT